MEKIGIEGTRADILGSSTAGATVASDHHAGGPSPTTLDSSSLGSIPKGLNRQKKKRSIYRILLAPLGELGSCSGSSILFIFADPGGEIRHVIFESQAPPLVTGRIQERQQRKRDGTP